MSSLSDNDNSQEKTTSRCEECEKTFEEFLSVALFKAGHPPTRVLCISCDPKADAPALVHVTLKGRAQTS